MKRIIRVRAGSLAVACVLAFGGIVMSDGVAAQTVQGGSITGAGTGASASLNTAATPRPATASRLDEIIARGTLRICTTGDYKPYSFLRPDGKFEGIDIDAAQSLAQSLNVKPEFVKTSWSNLMGDFHRQMRYRGRRRIDIARTAETGVLHAAVYGGRQDANRPMRRYR